MSKIIRIPSKVTGGITPEEKIALDAHAQLWIKRALRTDPIEPDKIIPAIEGIYASAGLKKPRVVIVPSPLVMAFAYGASAAIWHDRRGAGDKLIPITTDSATYDATRKATDSATYIATDSATDIATRNATHNATYDATDTATDTATGNATDIATDTATYDATYIPTYNATYDATDTATGNATRNATDIGDPLRIATRNATDIATRAPTLDPEKQAAAACLRLAGGHGVACAKEWSANFQGGNMGAAYESYLTAFRDILGLRLKEHAAYAHWEQAAIHGGFRVVHPEFCIVSDFPEVLKIDVENRPHCETGPSHRWRDGWSLYHWHGVRIPAEWIEDRASLTAKAALTWTNIEQRRAACEIVGWSNILKELNAKTIDRDDDPEIGELVEVTIEGSRERFLRVLCGTKREFSLPVPPDVKTALAANAWTYAVDGEIIKRIEVRT